MKCSKSVIMLIVVGVVVCLILVGTYSAVTSFSTQDTPIDRTPKGPQIQILSPRNNTTYQTRNVMFNITANNATAKITYFLDREESNMYIEMYPHNKGVNMDGFPVTDGDFNITYIEPGEFSRDLIQGVHTLTVYAFDEAGNVGDCQIITFMIDLPVPPVVSMTRQELQATIDYFESEGLIVVPPDPKSAYIGKRDIAWFESKEEFVTSLKENGVTAIIKFDTSPDISFCGFAGPGPLLFMYSFRVIII